MAIWSSNYCSYLKRETLIRRAGTQDGSFFPSLLRTVGSCPHQLLFYALVLIELKPDTIPQAMPAESPNNTMSGQRQSVSPKRRGTMLFACASLRVCGFKCLGDPASRRDRRCNRYVLTIPCNIMISSRCSLEADIDTLSGEEKGNAAIEIEQK